MMTVHFCSSIAMTQRMIRLVFAACPQCQNLVGTWCTNVENPPMWASAMIAATSVTGMSRSICTNSLAVVLHEPPSTAISTTIDPAMMIVVLSGIPNAAATNMPIPLSQMPA